MFIGSSISLNTQALTLAGQVANILRKYGTDAHVYLPGIGVLNGITAGNYLDSAGTTPATVDNPVGLALDGAGSVGAELGDGQTISLSPATEVFIGTTVIGKTYLVNIPVGCQGNFGPGWNTTTAATGLHYRVADGTGFRVRNFGATTVDLTKTLKEVTGIHATQATTANKPILRRGAVNLLTYSEQFDNAAWAKNNCTVGANAANSPIATLTADKLIESATTAGHYLSRSITVTAGIPVTISVYAKSAERSVFGLIALSNVNAGEAGYYADLSAGTISQNGGTGFTGGTPSIENIGGGYYRLNITYTPATAEVRLRFYVLTAASVPANGSYAGDGTSGIYIWGADLKAVSTLTDYIPTTTAPASSSTGNYHWIADSTDLLTATYPAGYESATVINALAAGQQTLTAQNIVGAYNIGPSIDTYGRFIFRTGLTASELTTMQTFANRLAGV